MTGRLVAGIDSSTQQTKLVVVDAGTGELVRSSALPHPESTELDPRRWWEAFDGVGGRRPPGAEAIGVAAQQHTAIFLDDRGEPVRDAILWNDLRARPAGAHLRDERGSDDWLDRVGLLPDSAHPVSKLRWLATAEPDSAARVDAVLLPHEWLTWRLLGATHAPTTDRSDASATGYFSANREAYDDDLVACGLGRSVGTPQVLAPDAVSGTAPGGLVVSAGCGDNAATHLALGTRPGDMVISVGTSSTVSMRTERPARDATGAIDTMADARDGFIPIIAMLNGARVLASTARLLGVGLDRFDELAGSADPMAEGVMFLPYLDGERNPPRPASRGGFVGLARGSMTPQNVARATMLGLGCAIANAVDALAATFGAPTRVLLVGGGSRSCGLRQVIADLTGRTIHRPEDREHAAYGAARQAAWALTGTLPAWNVRQDVCRPDPASPGWAAEVRHQFRTADAANTRASCCSYS